MKYWIQAPANAPQDVRLDMSDIYFAEMPDGEGDGAHISLTEDKVTIHNVTLFPGHLTNWRAIRWGATGILHLGPHRIERLKRLFQWRRR